MGVDFFEKIKRPFKKHLDVQRVKLATPDLFTRQPTEQCRLLAAEVLGDARVSLGQEFTAEPNGKTIVLRAGGLAAMAVIQSAPADILQAIQECGGIARAVVQEVHLFSGVAEVTIC